MMLYRWTRFLDHFNLRFCQIRFLFRNLFMYEFCGRFAWFCRESHSADHFIKSMGVWLKVVEKDPINLLENNGCLLSSSDKKHRHSWNIQAWIRILQRPSIRFDSLRIVCRQGLGNHTATWNLSHQSNQQLTNLYVFSCSLTSFSMNMNSACHFSHFPTKSQKEQGLAMPGAPLVGVDESPVKRMDDSLKLTTSPGIFTSRLVYHAHMQATKLFHHWFLVLE